MIIHHISVVSWGLVLGAQVPLMLASPNMGTNSQLVSLKETSKYGELSLKLDLGYFMQKYLQDLGWGLGLAFLLDPTHNTSPKPYLQ